MLNLLAVGCILGGANDCKNSGICLWNGLCECPFGYTGSTCTKCEFFTK